ncbi:MAG: putative LPS assembly protein LptD [Bacteroidota bacterium]
MYGNVYAQDTIVKTDSTLFKNDTIANETSDYALSSKVDYTAGDSIRFDVINQKMYLYGNAEINYEDITLTADYIEVTFKINQLYAKGMPDSTGKVQGKPIFNQGAQSFSSATLTYNFKSKKGLITGIITKEGDSYIHGTLVKKFPDNSFNIKNGQYTTCENEHPHYEIKFGKARVIPDDKIVSGPAYLVIEDVPTPLAVPFGFFPNKRGQKSGILIPSYGESANRGFFLENGGYYMGLGQRMDIALRGDIYSRGSWAAKAASNYNVRYKYNGIINVGYATNIDGEKNTSSYNKINDFFIRWTHHQDAKARPNSRFAASVNIVSKNNNKYNPSSNADYLSNTFQSNISYITTFGSNFNFSANMRHSQNVITGDISLNLPELALTMNRIYPFRREKPVGKEKWFEKISLSYSMNASNSISSNDSILFPINEAFDISRMTNLMKNGVKHYIPISSSVKVLKYFTFTNSFNYNERWYFQSIRKQWSNEWIIIEGDTISSPHLKTDTVNGFCAAHDFNLSSSLSTRLYGMYQFNGKWLKAVRHVITPTASITYTPDFGTQWWGYYKYYMDDSYTGNDASLYQYSIFSTGIYGSPPQYKSGMVNFSFANNLEMKVRSKKDSITGTKKISLIDNFTISGGYDLAKKDSLQFSKVLMSGRTKLFKNLDITYASIWDPYVIDSTGKNLKDFEWKINHRLLRNYNNEWAFSLNWSLRSKEKKKTLSSDKATEEELAMINANRDMYIDFEEPWSLNLYYTLRHTSVYSPVTDAMENDLIQTFSFNGDVSITKKWKVGISSGYDFRQNELTPTSVNIYRDLHCWEIVFNWIPSGFRKSYNLTIRVKSAVLQDLKLTKKKDMWDY